MAVKVDTRMMLDRTLVMAKRSGVAFNVASIPASFNAPSQGSFDPKYMGALFQTGYALGQSANPFSAEPPPYPRGPTRHRVTSRKPERTDEECLALDLGRDDCRLAGSERQHSV